MGLFSRHRKPSRPAETLTPPRIDFVGEQSGPAEEGLKAQFRQVLLRIPTVERAYLAQLSLGEPPAYSVGLCIRAMEGIDQPLQKRLGQIFTDTFKRDQFLDILFISAEQEERLKQLCMPFYEKT